MRARVKCLTRHEAQKTVQVQLVSVPNALENADFALDPTSPRGDAFFVLTNPATFAMFEEGREYLLTIEAAP